MSGGDKATSGVPLALLGIHLRKVLTFLTNNQDFFWLPYRRLGIVGTNTYWAEEYLGLTHSSEQDFIIVVNGK